IAVRALRLSRPIVVNPRNPGKPLPQRYGLDRAGADPIVEYDSRKCENAAYVQSPSRRYRRRIRPRPGRPHPLGGADVLSGAACLGLAPVGIASAMGPRPALARALARPLGSVPHGNRNPSWGGGRAPGF